MHHILAICAWVLLILLMQSVNGAQVLSITYFLFLSAAIALVSSLCPTAVSKE